MIFCAYSRILSGIWEKRVLVRFFKDNLNAWVCRLACKSERKVQKTLKQFLKAVILLLKCLKKYWELDWISVFCTEFPFALNLAVQDIFIYIIASETKHSYFRISLAKQETKLSKARVFFCDHGEFFIFFVGEGTCSFLWQSFILHYCS